MPPAERRSPSPWPWVVTSVVLLVLAAATAVTVERSQPHGLGPRERQTEGDLAATARKRAGTTCAGWPLALTPSVEPGDARGAVALWGDRDGFHLENGAGAQVTVDVVAQAGSLRIVDGRGDQLAEDHLRLVLAPGAAAEVTATCATEVLAVATTPREVGFALADGPAPSPATFEKRRSA